MVVFGEAPEKRPPVQVTGARVQPTNFILTELGVTPAACSALMASTRLFSGSPAVFAGVACDAVSGMVVAMALPMWERRPSYPAKKKSLSFSTGPPTTPPNCSNWVGRIGLGAGLKALRASQE